jgi:hypothetical protein
MTEPQKVVVCRYCPKEITWTTDPVTGKNYPKNLDGTPHNCRSESKSQAVTKEQPVNTGSCTSPDTPAANPSNKTGLKTVEGQITYLDLAAHKVVVKDRRGETTTFIWAPPFNEQMQKLKQWFFIRATGEHEPDFGLYRLTAQEFFKRPEDWPATVHSRVFGGQPRNDKAIILQTCLKVAADVLIARGFCEDNDPPFEEQMDRITAAAIKAAGELCKVGGVQ